MLELQRITTEFIDSEDRIRLCGECAPQQTVVLWLTQRLLNRLVPHLLSWLAQQTGVSGGLGADMRAELAQSFAQQAAVATMEPQAPVRANATQQAWLVHSVDVTVNPQAVRLTFKGQPTPADQPDPLMEACVSMQALPLRQWLSIVHEQCRRAGWVSASTEASGHIWPEWIQGKAQLAKSAPTLLH